MGTTERMLGDGGARAREPRREAIHLRPGQVVPQTRYRIVRWIGEGGMGVVYEAAHVHIEQRVALKIMRAPLSDADAIGRFRAEAMALSRIGGAEAPGTVNVVRIYDFGALPDGRPFIAMEYLDGASLAETLSAGPFDRARSIAILRQIAKGLATAHAAGVVHRDIKASNVVLVRSGQRDDAVKVVDFGVAALEGDRGETVVGTPGYMAPEQVDGRTEPRTDQYGLACLAFRLFAGRPPFVASSELELFAMHRSHPVPRLADLGVDVPEELEAVLRRCLEKRPEARFASMDDLELALCEAQVAAGIHTAWDDLALPPTSPERAARLRGALGGPSRRRRWWPFALVAALGIGAGASLFAVSTGDTAPSEASNLDEIEVHAERARDAASEAYFIYPPAEDPTRPTAYTEVLALESLDEPLSEPGRAAASELRRAFASTLVRLGDRYWDVEGGRPFATDYYLAARMFEPDNTRASERASVTAGEFLALRLQAEHVDFDHADLIASSPLIVLAEEDDDERRHKMAALERSVRARSYSTASNLRKLLRAEGVETEPEASAAVPADPSLEADDDEHILVVDAGTEDDQDEGQRDVAQSRALASAAYRKLKRGRRDEAEALLHRALDLDRRNAAAAHGLSLVMFERGRYDRMRAFARKAVALAPRRAEYRINLGDAYFNTFSYRKAREAYEKAKDLGHAEADARIARVRRKLE